MTIQQISPTVRRGASSNFTTVDEPSSVEDARSSGIKTRPTTLSYPWLWQILAQQNSSMNFFSIDDLVLLQGLDGASSSGWAMTLRTRPLFGLTESSAQTQTPEKSFKRISLAQARQQALRALHQAEERRQQEREREAQFWAALDDEA